MLTTREDKFLSTLSISAGVVSQSPEYPEDKATFIQEFSTKISGLKSYTLRKHTHKINVMLASAGVLAHEGDCERRTARMRLLAKTVQHLVNYDQKIDFSWEKFDNAVASLHKLLMDDVCSHGGDLLAEEYKFKRLVAHELLKYQREEVESSSTNSTLFLYTYNVLQESVFSHILDLYTALEEGSIESKAACLSISDLMSRCNGIRINSKSLQHAEKKYAKAIVSGENIDEAREVLDRKIRICFNLTNEISDLLEDATDLLEDDGSDLRGDTVDSVH